MGTATAPDRVQADRDRTAALALIEDAAVMTLAVTTAEGPWAAPVYFVYRSADTGFYFFSSPESRHVTAGLETGGCGAAIFRSAQIWQEICGLQMRGMLTPATDLKGGQALSLYLNKFPFSRGLLSRTLLADGKVSLEAFRNLLGVRLYRFRASQIEWTDNRIRFGYRCRLTL
jgi:uncharacterized protein YhbP (UPF0306 family)